MVVKILLTLVVLVNGAFAVVFIRDLVQHWKETFQEAGNPVAVAISSFVIFFFPLSAYPILQSAHLFILKQNGSVTESCPAP